GRAGDASIEALALLGSDGTTDLEITANGTIGKVQVKLPGDVTQNYNDDSGTSFNQRLTGLARHAPVGVHVNVDGATRTGVVSATETVKLRPDLKIDGVTAPPHALAGSPFHVSAVVREANGDVGARASCVLLANGVEVDRANNIWVDAGGTVTCEMAHLFRPGAGTVSLSVALAGTNPGDFDPSNNNSDSIEVRVYDQAGDWEPWTAGAQERTFSRRTWYRTPYSENESTNSGWTVGTYFRTTFNDQNLDVENLTASVHTMSDGQVIHESNDITFAYETRYDWDWDIVTTCAKGMIDDRYSMVVSCRKTTPWDPPTVSFAYNLSAGDATFVSRGWSRLYLGNGQYGDVFHHNSTSPDVYGQPFHLGDSVSWDVRISDGTNYWEKQQFLQLTPYGWHNEQPDSCTPAGDWCTGMLDAESGKSGVMFSQP
ncbi:MAG TPA: hypothetical protein VEU30_16015, partial [Thermoanaerobaculia bacterium]|nr:hypothetical protein [Thermoanaerobaculia bacterium]